VEDRRAAMILRLVEAAAVLAILAAVLTTP
jgi:hypothetical protein